MKNQWAGAGTLFKNVSFRRCSPRKKNARRLTAADPVAHAPAEKKRKKEGKTRGGGANRG